MLNLHRKMDQIAASTDALNREAKTTMLELSIQRDEHAQLQTALVETRQVLESMRAQSHEMDVSRAAREQEVHGQIQELLRSRSSVR